MRIEHAVRKYWPGILAVALLFALVLCAGSRPWSITDTNERTVNVSGYQVTYSMPWGHSGYVCNVNGGVDQYANDQSTPTTLNIIMTSPNTGGMSCSNYGAAGAFTIRGINPKTVQTMTIHRTTVLELDAQYPSWQSCAAEQCIGTTETLPGQKVGGFHHSYGDVTIVNNGAGFTVNSPEGTTIISSTTPVDITFRASVTPGGATSNHGGYVQMTLNGIDTTSVPIPPSGNPTVTTPPTPVGFWDWLLALIRRLFGI